MARIRITDLPQDMKITPQEMRRVRGGAEVSMTFLKIDSGGQDGLGPVPGTLDKSSPLLAKS